MIKKTLLILSFGMTLQPLYSAKPLNKTTNSSSSSWVRSPWVWGTIALAGTLSAWVYRQYQNYRKSLNGNKTIISSPHLENKEEVKIIEGKKEQVTHQKNYFKKQYDAFQNIRTKSFEEEKEKKEEENLPSNNQSKRIIQTVKGPIRLPRSTKN